MEIDKELFSASDGLKYPVVARPYADDMKVKEKFFTKADMVAILDKIRAEIEDHCALAKENHCKYCSYCNNVMGVREILEIIDKNKAESEETNDNM